MAMNKILIRSYISSTRNCGVVVKLERFSHLAGQSFRFGSSISLGYLSLVLSLRAGV